MNDSFLDFLIKYATLQLSYLEYWIGGTMEILIGLLFLVLIWVIIALLTTNNDRNELRRKLDNARKIQTDYQRQFDDLKRKAEKAYAQNEELRKSLSKCEKELAAETYSRTYIAKDLYRLTEEHEKLKSVSNRIKSKDSTLENNYKILDGNFSSLKIKHDSLLEAHEKLSREYDKLKQQYEEQEKPQALDETLKRECEKLTGELSRLRSENDVLRIDNNTLKHEYNELKEEYEKLERTHKYVENQQTILTTEIKRLKGFYSKLRNSFDLHPMVKYGLKTPECDNKIHPNNNALKHENDNCIKREKVLANEIIIQKERNKQLNFEKERLQAKINNLRYEEKNIFTTVEKYNDEIKLLEAKKKTLLKDIKTLSNKIDDLEEDVESLAEEKTEILDNIDILLEEKEELKTTLKHLNREKEIICLNLKSLTKLVIAKNMIEKETEIRLEEKKDVEGDLEELLTIIKNLQNEKKYLENEIKYLSDTKNNSETSQTPPQPISMDSGSSDAYDYNDQIKSQIKELDGYIRKVTEIETEIKRSERVRSDENLSNALDLLIFFRDAIRAYKKQAQDLRKCYISIRKDSARLSQETASAIAKDEAQKIIEVRKIKDQLQSEADELRSQIIKLTQQKNELAQDIKNINNLTKVPELCQTCKHKYLCMRSGRGLKPKLSIEGSCSLVAAYNNKRA